MSGTPDEPVFGLPSRSVWKLAQIPPSTLNYWVQIGLVHPSLQPPDGHRVEQWWSIPDVITVRTVRALRTAGVPLPQIRAAKRAIQGWGLDFTSAHLVWDGTDLVMTDAVGDLLSAAKAPGQRMLQFAALPVHQWAAEALADPEGCLLDLAELRRARRRRAAERKTRRLDMESILRDTGTSQM